VNGRVIDISVALERQLPTWPGSRGHRTYRTMAIESGDAANVTQLEMDVHAGTHVENSLHFLADGDPVAQIAIERLVGPALWHAADPIFDPQYVALTAEAAHWLVDRHVDVVGIDYLSVQRFEDPPETHRILMRAGIAIIEGLDLSDAGPGVYDLVCLPLSLSRAEAAPARVVLVERNKPA